MTGTYLSLKLNEICRSCLTEEGSMICIFQNAINPNVTKMFEDCTSLQVFALLS